MDNKDKNTCYRLGKGFSYRREEFGGILYHYQGTRPDPGITFVTSPFLIDLLDVLHGHPEEPLQDLIDAVSDHFQLAPAQIQVIEGFLTTLTERGALVPQS